MVGDADLVITEYHSLIDFVIRKCNTESKVLRQLFIIHTNSWKSHRSRELDRRILISDIAASFSYWVYIRESITDVQVEVKEESPAPTLQWISFRTYSHYTSV